MKRLFLWALLGLSLTVQAQLQHLPDETPMAVMYVHAQGNAPQAVAEVPEQILEMLNKDPKMMELYSLISKVHFAVNGTTAGYISNIKQGEVPQVVVAVPVDSIDGDFVEQLVQLWPDSLRKPLVQWENGWSVGADFDSKVSVDFCYQDHELIFAIGANARELMNKTTEPTWLLDPTWGTPILETKTAIGNTIMAQMDLRNLLPDNPAIWRMNINILPSKNSLTQIYSIDNPKMMDKAWDFLVESLDKNEKVNTLRKNLSKNLLVIPNTKKPDYGYLNLEDLSGMIGLKDILKQQLNMPVEIELPSQIRLQYLRKKKHTLVITSEGTFKP